MHQYLSREGILSRVKINAGILPRNGVAYLFIAVEGEVALLAACIMQLGACTRPVFPFRSLNRRNPPPPLPPIIPRGESPYCLPRGRKATTCFLLVRSIVSSSSWKIFDDYRGLPRPNVGHCDTFDAYSCIPIINIYWQLTVEEWMKISGRGEGIFLSFA